MTAVLRPAPFPPSPRLGGVPPARARARSSGGRARTLDEAARPAQVAARARFRRRRAVVVAVAAVLLGAGASIGVPGGGPLPLPGPAPAVAPVAVSQSSYVVEPGDTLWDIARALQPKGDVRPLVQRLSAARQGAPLQPGERLELPRP